MHPTTQLERRLEHALVAVLERGDYHDALGIERFNGEPFLVCYSRDEIETTKVKLSLATLAKQLAKELNA